VSGGCYSTATGNAAGRPEPAFDGARATGLGASSIIWGVTAKPRIPLFPLPDVVHFPRTDLKLHIFEPRYRKMIRDVAGREEAVRWIGMVLLKPGNEPGPVTEPEIFPGGTAGRLVDIDYLPDGRSNIVLHGEFRFAVEREVGGLAVPYRRAIVRPLAEPSVDEDDPDVIAVRNELVTTCKRLSVEMGDLFPGAAEDVVALEAGRSFESLVNGLAAALDLPAVRKIDLLDSSLPDRATELVRILRSRRRFLDLLGPYRHLAGQAEWN